MIAKISDWRMIKYFSLSNSTSVPAYLPYNTSSPTLTTSEMFLTKLCAASDTTLPALLRTDGGRTVRNARQWERQRRPEILRMLSAEVYGIAPDKLYNNFHVAGGDTSLEIGSLNSGVEYYFTVDSYNECGITRGRRMEACR